jgi:hypothetical protein
MPNRPGQSGGNYFDTPIFNAAIPPEGPKALPFTFPFVGTEAEFTVELTLTQTQQFLSIVQGAYVDNSLNDTPFSITASGTGQVLTIPPYTQGYLPVMVAKPTSFVISGACENEVGVIFYNIPVPSLLWDVQGSGSGGDATTTMMATSGVTVDDTATEIASGGQTDLLVTNTGTNLIAIGDSDAVTFATGYPLAPGDTIAMNGYAGDLWGIADTGLTSTISVAQFS